MSKEFLTFGDIEIEKKKCFLLQSDSYFLNRRRYRKSISI